MKEKLQSSISVSAEWRRLTFFLCVFFCRRVPELVGTFRRHCYRARFLGPPAFVSLSPIVPASFVPQLKQCLLFFLCLFLYRCTFCPCASVLFFSLLWRSFCYRPSCRWFGGRRSGKWKRRDTNGWTFSVTAVEMFFSLGLATPHAPRCVPFRLVSYYSSAQTIGWRALLTKASIKPSP